MKMPNEMMKIRARAARTMAAMMPGEMEVEEGAELVDDTEDDGGGEVDALEGGRMARRSCWLVSEKTHGCTEKLKRS